MVCNKVYWEYINPSMKTKKAQLIFPHFGKSYCGGCVIYVWKFKSGEVVSAVKKNKRICQSDIKFFDAGR